jgi:branched-chain amino acid transport system substrate-binding protein
MLHESILKRSGRRWQALRDIGGGNVSTRQRSGALAIGVALLASACATPQRPVVVAPPPVAGPPAVKPPQPLPQVAQNRVALLVPLTGANAPVGQSIANAANMAMLDVGDRRVNLRIYDTAPGAGAAAARALADGAGLVLGPLLAGDVAAVESVTRSRGVPIISFSNDSSVAGGDTYILGFQPSQSIARSIAYAAGRGVARFAALVPAGVYGQRAQSAFVRAVDAVGGRSTAVQSYTRDPAKMAAAVRAVTGYEARSRAAAAAPTIRPDGSVAPISVQLPPPPFQALLIADSGSVANMFSPSLSRYGAGPGSVVLIGTELWNSEPALARAASLRGGLFAAVPDENFRRLATRYRTKFGASPSRLASLGYDAVLLVNAVANGWALGTPFPTAALGTRAGFAGIDGAFRFSGGNIAERALEVQQIGNGTITTVDPAPRSFGN